MDIWNRHWVVAHKDKLGDSLLEVGSQIVSGQEAIALRVEVQPLVKEYIGLDMGPANGVDIVADAKHIPFPDNRFDSVVSLDCFEHVDWPRDVARECARVLKPGGYFLLATVFAFPIHGYPDDYWRFTPHCLKLLMEDAGLEVIELTQAPELTTPGVVQAIGRKPL